MVRLFSSPLLMIACLVLTATSGPALADTRHPDELNPTRSKAVATKVTKCKMVPGPKHSAIGIHSGETVLLDDRSEVRLESIFAPRAPLLTPVTPGSERTHTLVAQSTRTETDVNPRVSVAKNSKVPKPPAGTVWPVEQTAVRSLTDLILGRSVQLYFTSRKRTDRYGAHTAQLFIIDGAERIWVQRSMVARGFARVDPSSAPGPCTNRLLDVERIARRNRRGLWRHAPYAVRPAWKTRDLLRYVRTFQIVEGRVHSVGDSRGRLYLNFGKRWSTDFTATISKRVRKRLEKQGIDLKALKGKRVHIRGWVEDWNGPAIRITKASQIEMVTGKKNRSRRKFRRGRRSEPRGGYKERDRFDRPVSPPHSLPSRPRQLETRNQTAPESQQL